MTNPTGVGRFSAFQDCHGTYIYNSKILQFKNSAKIAEEQISTYYLQSNPMSKRSAIPRRLLPVSLLTLKLSPCLFGTFGIMYVHFLCCSFSFFFLKSCIDYWVPAFFRKCETQYCFRGLSSSFWSHKCKSVPHTCFIIAKSLKFNDSCVPDWPYWDSRTVQHF